MKFLILLINLTFIIATTNCQNLPVDTVNLARSKANDKKFSEANDLLTLYNAHKKDQYAIQLQAQILYWMKEFKKAELLYEEGTGLYPDYISLKLDYARMLYQLNKTGRARDLFLEYLSADKKNAEANVSVAWIDLQNGHISSAKKRAQYITNIFPGNKEAESILLKIEELTAPYLKLKGGAYSDDQPLQQSFIEPEAGIYRSWLLSAFIKASFNQQNTEQAYSTSWISAGNKIFIGATKTNIELAAGYFQGNNYQGNATWKILLTQKLSNSFSADAGTEKKPYQYTLASIMNPFLYQVSEAGLNFNKHNKWLGRVAYQSQHFDDGNLSNTIYAWLLAPLIDKKEFSLKAGYSFSYANSDKNTFTPKTALTPPYVPNKEVEGMYEPYFTPNQQYINAALISIGIPLSKSVSISSRASIGFYARADQPSLYIDRNGSGPFFINKKYESLSYTPLEITSELNIKIAKQFYISGNYTYNSLIFFKSNSGYIQLKYLFINDKRK